MWIQRWAAGIILLSLAIQLRASEPAAEKIQYFEKHVRPLLLQRCASCHGNEKQEGKLRLDSPEFLLSGGESGDLYLSGQPDSSLLIAAVKRVDASLTMPPEPEKPLSPAEVETLAKWVRDGATLPISSGESVPVDPKRIEEGKNHWAFQTSVRSIVPSDTHDKWSANSIDRFVWTKLKSHGLTPRSEAEKSIWLRRVTLDMVGLPPTVAEIESFLQDNSQDAKSKVVERLLGSPHYGVRWGRHWLDIARYADSNGLDENIAHGNAWRYRDYVVDSWNSDKPYNQFVLEQIAGDLLADQSEPAGPNAERRQREYLIATGFLALGPKVLAEVDKQKMEMDIIDEQLDTIGKSFLGLTLGCARCHDHKFDPISTEDYYGLAGILKSTKTMESYKTIAKWHENSLANETELQRQKDHQQSVDSGKKEIERVRSAAIEELKKSLKLGEELPKDPEPKLPDAIREDLKNKRDQLAKLEASAPELPSAMGVTEGIVADIPVHIRGSHLALGRIVPRGVPAVFVSTQTPRMSKQMSGRESFARWLVEPNNPLTARVIVNRLWRWHFGLGLVASTDNFGLLGDKPSHPELLDWLAVELIENDWSIKHIQRLILLSQTYGQSSQFDSLSAEKDPRNQYLWRYSIRRMEAEVFRDSILAVGGVLDMAKGQSLLHVKNREFLFNHTSIDKTKYDSHLRSIFVPVIRNHLYDVFYLFDYSDAANVNGNRDSTTIAPQALFMLNSGLVHEAAGGLARGLLSGPLVNDGARVDELWRRLYAHPPVSEDREAALTFLKQNAAVDELQRWTWLCQSALASNDFAFVR